MAEPQDPAGTVDAPAMVVVGQDSSITTQPEAPVATKPKGRHRLLQGIQRISSSPSLTGLRRSRSVSAPYSLSTRSSLSCVSLAVAGPVRTPHSQGSSTPQASPLGQPSSSSSTTEFPFFESIEAHLPVRNAQGCVPGSAHATAPVPADVKLGRSDTQSKSRSRAASAAARKKLEFRFWDTMPHEIQVYIFSFLLPKELVRASRVSKSFYRFCFDGQLWTSLDASEFYKDIPADSLARIISSAGPFIKVLNLRGCVQVEHYKRAEVLVKACKNLMNATLEGCRNFQKGTLHSLLETNQHLVYLNLTGLTAVSNKSCKIIAESCPQLDTLNISWCGKVDHRGIYSVISGCPKLKDLRAGEIRGFNNLGLALRIFQTNNLERLVLSGCAELTDEALEVMLHGKDPEMDILTDLPIVPPRKLRHLDLSRCSRLTDKGVKAIAHLTPDLEGLQLSRCKLLTDAALEPILASTPRLTHLELEDLEELTNDFLIEHLAKAPCAGRLEHLSLSYCENLGDAGMLPVMQKCTRLQNIELDNTRISDLTLAEAASMVNKRSRRVMEAGGKPQVTLRMVVYDCQNVTWMGIREVLFRNANVKPAVGHPGRVSYPTESISLKCFYGFQMTVDEHQKRVLRGDFDSAATLERRWADYMQASEEAGMGGSGHRRRRRRAREAQALHMNEEDGNLGQGGRRRARTMGSCLVM
ncbi:unnamed protein product [Clonostachys rhizophaga]|uniref:F-box domain-containing protein n=1 Tax=Clonostachys rhizophaga TaxID=160324 RepID=A0A9N9YQB6_9HYPO|nr:unnamed protein product [Clonostachys rhizophaga]